MAIKVIFTGWKEGIRKISLTHALHEHAGLSLTQSKLNVDAIINNITVDVWCPTREEAKNLLFKACELGAEGMIQE